jgi:hypothetical protein
LSGLSISDYLKQNGTGHNAEEICVTENYITEGSDENSDMGGGVFHDVFSAFHRMDVRLAQYAPYNGQEDAFSLTYLLNLFFLHVVMVPYYEFFQTEHTAMH